MWGQYHSVPYQSKIKEKFLTVFGIGLSFKQALWWATGLFLSVKMSKIIPPIGNDWMYSRIHYAIPFALCMYLCYFKHTGTNLPVWRYYSILIQLRVRCRVFLYKKGGT